MGNINNKDVCESFESTSQLPLTYQMPVENSLALLSPKTEATDSLDSRQFYPEDALFCNESFIPAGFKRGKEDEFLNDSLNLINQTAPGESSPDADPAEQKPTDDGYRWRKYGRKSVKGSKYPRSYYKCTFPGCNVKKQVEVVVRNNKTESNTVYKGKHEHEPPQVTHVHARDQQSYKKVVLDGFAKFDNVKYPSNSANQPRLVVETVKEVNHLDDGYRWRKYGQKHVKGSKYPRSYYKCTESECQVKKQVDQLDDTIVNTYEGTHTHPPPCADGVKRKRRRSSGCISPPLCPPSVNNTYSNHISYVHNSSSCVGQLSPGSTVTMTPSSSSSSESGWKEVSGKDQCGAQDLYTYAQKQWNADDVFNFNQMIPAECWPFQTYGSNVDSGYQGQGVGVQQQQQAVYNNNFNPNWMASPAKPMMYGRQFAECEDYSNSLQNQ